MNELQASAFINGAEMAMIDSGINVKPGSGVAAASEYWRKALENDAKVQNISNKEVAKKVEEKLLTTFDVTLNVEDKPLSEAELIEGMKSYDALLPTVTDPITDKIISTQIEK